MKKTWMKQPLKSETARMALGAMRAAAKDSGNTYSRACGTTIGSGSLTTVFGMGTGVTFQICSPEIRVFTGAGMARRR